MKKEKHFKNTKINVSKSMPKKKKMYNLIDKFLQMLNFPKLNQEEMENMCRPIPVMKLNRQLKKLPTNKSPGLYGFLNEFYQII